MTASAGEYTVDVVADVDKLRFAMQILASMCEGIAHELRAAAADLNRLTDPGPTDGTAYHQETDQ